MYWQIGTRRVFMDIFESKYKSMLEIEKYERAIIELKNWTPGKKLSASTFRLSGEINSIEERDGQIKLLSNICSESRKDKESYNNKLYLSDIIEKEKPKFGLNNLILAPTGSGKSTFMRKLIKEESVLFLVSTTSLKDKLVPHDEEERKLIKNRMYSTKHKRVYGKTKKYNYKILVMTYSEFGEKIKFTDKFADQFKQIFCDEIHSLFNYYSMSQSDTLLGAIKYLFKKKTGQTKFYFTATDEYLEKIKKESEDLFFNIDVFDYLRHKDIVKHMVLSSYKINNLEQVRPHLRAKVESFEYFGYKVFAFCKTISSQQYLEKILIEEGFKPLVLWSINNDENKMTEEQLKHREYILKTGLIPDEYDSLIINSSMQEGWDLLDPKVKLVIMNTTNKTEFIQAVGRVRRDVDVLVYKVNSDKIEYFINFPPDLLDVPLTSKMKEQLVLDLNLKNKRGKLLKWPSINEALINQGLKVETKNIRIDNKSTRVSIVSKY